MIWYWVWYVERACFCLANSFSICFFYVLFSCDVYFLLVPLVLLELFNGSLFFEKKGVQFIKLLQNGVFLCSVVLKE